MKSFILPRHLLYVDGVADSMRWLASYFSCALLLLLFSLFACRLTLCLKWNWHPTVSLKTSAPNTLTSAAQLAPASSAIHPNGLNLFYPSPDTFWRTSLKSIQNWVSVSVVSFSHSIVASVITLLNKGWYTWIEKVLKPAHRLCFTSMKQYSLLRIPSPCLSIESAMFAWVRNE